MARRGRRRRRVTWFPPIGNTSVGENDVLVSGQELQLEAPADGTPGTLIFPLTFDIPKQASLAQVAQGETSLADMIGSGYYLRRIVGKAFIGVDQRFSPAGGSIPFYAVVVTLAFFVARAADQIQNNQPVGAETDYDPNLADNITEPWIWRRMWVLGNSRRIDTEITVQGPGPYFPPTNVNGFGSALDGPHIDAKTVRKVMGDDRLWGVLSVRGVDDTLNVPTAEDSFLPTGISGILDYRILGSLAKQRPSGRF